MSPVRSRSLPPFFCLDLCCKFLVLNLQLSFFTQRALFSEFFRILLQSFVFHTDCGKIVEFLWKQKIQFSCSKKQQIHTNDDTILAFLLISTPIVSASSNRIPRAMRLAVKKNISLDFHRIHMGAQKFSS